VQLYSLPVGGDGELPLVGSWAADAGPPVVGLLDLVPEPAGSGLEDGEFVFVGAGPGSPRGPQATGLEVGALADLVIAFTPPDVVVLTQVRLSAQPFLVGFKQRELDMVGPCLRLLNSFLIKLVPGHL
jgi:hypothetical protein